MQKFGIAMLQAVVIGLVLLIGSQLCRTTPLGAQADPPVADIVKAKSFQLVDDAGRTRIQLEMGSTGARICLRNPAGVSTMLVAERPDGASVLLSNPNTDNVQISLNVGKGPNGDTRPFLNLFDPNGQRRASLTLQHDGALLQYALPDGKPQTELYGFDGGTGLTMYDDKQRMRAVIGVEDSTGPAVIFRDADGKRLPLK